MITFMLGNISFLLGVSSRMTPPPSTRPHWYNVLEKDVNDML